jgi:hypothetical protein
MPNDQNDAETQRIIRELSDAQRLASRGISEEWIRSCAELVSEFQQLQSQFRELEAKLSRAEPESSQDTLLL